MEKSAEGEGTSNWQIGEKGEENGQNEWAKERKRWRTTRRSSTSNTTPPAEAAEGAETKAWPWPWPSASFTSAASFSAAQHGQFRHKNRPSSSAHCLPLLPSLAHCPRPFSPLLATCASSTLPLLLFLIFSSFPCPTNARKSNEIEADWSLQQQQQMRTNPSSPLAQSEQLSRQFVPTKYLRLKEVLRFHCPPPNVPLAIHLVPAESALLCQLPVEQRERERALIGYCGPNTSDPRLTIRRYSPLPGKPTFREGLSYFFISTSDGTAEGVQSISGGLCRSNDLRLRVVILPTSSDDSISSSRPADEITDLAELLFPHSPSSSIPPPLSPSNPSAASFGVFPAFLTLEDRGGQRRQVIVHSPTELAAQIDSANQRSGGVGLELSVHQQQQRRRGGGGDGRTAVGDGQMPRYEMSNSNGADTADRHPMKQVRSPDPLAESQKLVYIIGYGSESGAGGHEQTNGGNALATPTITLALSILTIATMMIIDHFFLLIP